MGAYNWNWKCLPFSFSPHNSFTSPLWIVMHATDLKIQFNGFHNNASQKVNLSLITCYYFSLNKIFDQSKSPYSIIIFWIFRQGYLFLFDRKFLNYWGIKIYILQFLISKKVLFLFNCKLNFLCSKNKNCLLPILFIL